MKAPFATLLSVILLLGWPSGVTAQATEDLAVLHQQDLRLAIVAENMLVGNRTLCRALMPVSGIVIHSRDQYGSTVPQDFAATPVAIAVVVPGSPAEGAGLRAGDGLVAIAGRPTPSRRRPAARRRVRARLAASGR